MHIWRKKRVNYNKFEIPTNFVNQIFNLNAFFFFLFTGATWYYHTIYLVFICFALFTDYEDDNFEVISNLHVQGSKFDGKVNKFDGKSQKRSWTPRSPWSLFFPSLTYQHLFPYADTYWYQHLLISADTYGYILTPSDNYWPL